MYVQKALNLNKGVKLCLCVLIMITIDMLDLAAEITKAGYAVVVGDDSPFCLHCTELTVLRVAC
jgi:hypothetical protein